MSRTVNTRNRTASRILDCYKLSFDDSEGSINCGENLNESERLCLRDLLNKHEDCFSKSLKDLGFTNVTGMVIELKDSQPIVYRPYRLSHAERSLVNEMVQEMIDGGIVRESSSPYASPIVLVQRKAVPILAMKMNNLKCQ
nr:unnamed protein product [Callosobruchus analis]